MKKFFSFSLILLCSFGFTPLYAKNKEKAYNVLFIISDDLTATALSC